MWIQVRTIDGKETRTVEDLSRLTKIESLRLKIQDIFNVSPQQQRLFYRGKQVKKPTGPIVSPPVMQQSKFSSPRGFFSLPGAAWSASGVRSRCFAAVSDPCELPVSIGIRHQFLRKSAGVRGGPTFRVVVGWGGEKEGATILHNCTGHILQRRCIVYVGRLAGKGGGVRWEGRGPRMQQMSSRPWTCLFTL